MITPTKRYATHEFEVTLNNGVAYIYADCYSYDWKTEEYVFYKGRAIEVIRYKGSDVVGIERTPD